MDSYGHKYPIGTKVKILPLTPPFEENPQYKGPMPGDIAIIAGQHVHQGLGILGYSFEEYNKLYRCPEQFVTPVYDDGESDSISNSTPKYIPCEPEFLEEFKTLIKSSPTKIRTDSDD